MKTIHVRGKEIKLYDSIDDMPIINFQKYNKYLLIDTCIGSDTEDIDNHISRVAKFIKNKNPEKAMQELQNMRQNLYMIHCQISPKYLAFAALIHSINGKKVDDLSDDNLKAILEEIREIKHSILTGILEWLKKKVATELETYFPEVFTNAREKDLYSKLQRRATLILESVAHGVNNAEQIAVIDKELLSAQRPKSFIGADSEEIKYDKQFESACVLIAQETHQEARNMTVLQFYTALDCIKKQAELKSKKLK